MRNVKSFSSRLAGNYLITAICVLCRHLCKVLSRNSFCGQITAAMIHLLRQHLAPVQANILVGALRAAGFRADVWGVHAAHLYGDLATGGCALVVDAETGGDAEAFLNAPPDESLDEPMGSIESCPTNANPPSLGTVMYVGAGLALIFSSLVAVASGLGRLVHGLHSNASAHLLPVPIVVVKAFLASLVASTNFVILFAMITGPLLLILRGYQVGSAPCRLIVFVVATMILCILPFIRVP